ncbi:Bax inhibitor-1 family protein [Photobacterium leiognathi]|uniref:Bax inhibitor-1 family protein n=1 Tax=Photobacterium leiognathi TaxID=553611 RepID=UPI002980A328|nr:Bax inhibitor-1 family protein [Photobacterium leiognathi]
MQTTRDFNESGKPVEISDHLFQFIIGAIIFYGFALNWVIVSNVDASLLTPYAGTVLIGYVVSAIIAAIITTKSKSPVVSFLGYNILVVPAGLMLVLALDGVPQNTIVGTIQLTSLITGLMMIVGMGFPGFFRSIIKICMLALLLTIAAEVVLFFVGVTLPLLNYVGIACLMVFIAFEWGTAVHSTNRTLDQAVDIACSMYLSILGLFLRLLNND